MHPPREVPQYTPPSYTYDPPPAPAPKYEPPTYAPPAYDERAELLPEPPVRKHVKPKPRCHPLPEPDTWTFNEQERGLYRIPESPTRRGRSSSPSRGALCSYRVNRGDTLTAIAEERFGCSSPRTIAKILAVNPGVHPDRIYAGQTLLMPKSLANAVEPPPCPVCPRAREQRYSGGGRGYNVVQTIPITL